MRRSCERVGCAEPASVAYGIDIGTLVVWLEHASPDASHHMNLLCDRHAERLILPRGWSIDDRREGTSRLFVAAQKDRVAAKPKPAAPKRAAAAKAPRATARRERDATTQLRVVTNDGLFDPTVPMSPPFVPRDATATVARVAEPESGSRQSSDDTSNTAAITDEHGAESVAPAAAVNDGAIPEPAVPSVSPARDATRSHPAGERRFFDRATANHTRPIARPADSSRAMFRDTTRGVTRPDDTYDFNQGDHVE